MAKQNVLKISARMVGLTIAAFLAVWGAREFGARLDPLHEDLLRVRASYEKCIEQSGKPCEMARIEYLPVRSEPMPGAQP